MGLVSRVSPVQTALRNCMRDEGRSFEVGNQVLISSHRKLLLAKAMVVNVAEKSGQGFRQARLREASCRMPLGQSRCIPQALPGRWVSPRFWHRLIAFRHFCSGSLALASLNHACRNLVPTFPQRSPPSLLTTAACGGLRSAPDCRPRRALLHLSYSYAPPCGPALLVTQDPERT